MPDHRVFETGGGGKVIIVRPTGRLGDDFVNNAQFLEIRGGDP